VSSVVNIYSPYTRLKIALSLSHSSTIYSSVKRLLLKTLLALGGLMVSLLIAEIALLIRRISIA
jgi:hypothetical protein